MAEANKPSHKPLREGFLLKRQRGKKVVWESQRKKLKFEERYCILTSSEFAYRKKEKAVAKGTLPVENIKVIERVKAETFSRQKCEFCFQVGDQNDMIYLVASGEIEMLVWMNDFRKVAKENQNTMSKLYHPGAYGSIRKERWSCCERAGATADGCESCSSGNGNKEIDLAKSYTMNHTPKSDMKPKMSHSFPRSGKKHSVTTIGSFMTTSGESDYNGDTSDYTSGEEVPSYSEPQHKMPPDLIVESPTVEHPNENEIPLRSRTNTQRSESGIDTDHGSRLNSNASCRSVISQTRSEFVKAQHEDEGIDTQYDTTAPPAHNTYSTRTGKSFSQATVSHIAVKRPVSSRVSTLSTGSTMLDAVQEEDAETNMNMRESYVLSQPISAVALLDSENKILTGTVDGMVRIWTASLAKRNKTVWNPILKLTKSLRVAGEVNSIDVYRNYLAVGSAFAQLVDLSDSELPRKVLVTDQRNLFSKSQHQKNLVAFARRGGEVMVVSATVGGDTINVWRLPSWNDKMPFVMKPDSSFNIGGPIESVLCTMTTSKSNNGWVAVVSVEHTLEHASVTLHLLNLQISVHHKHVIIFQDNVCDKVHLTFLHSGRKIAIGSGREFQVMETDTGHHLQSLTLRDTITSMHYSEGPEMSSGYLAVGLGNGDVDVIVRKKKQYTQTLTFSHDQPELEVTHMPAPAVALSFDGKFTWGVVIHPKGGLEVWQATHENKALPKVTNHPTLGMELENEGIIDQLEIFHYDQTSGQGITSSASQMQTEDHVELEVSNEVCADDELLAVEAGVVATSPLGPFIFPEGLSSVVSPIVWLCSVPQRSFSKLAKLKIPHCAHIDSIVKNHSGLRLLKADHTNVKLNKLGQRVIEFEDITSKHAGRLTFDCDNLSITVKDNHFCLYCLTGGYYLKEHLVNINFCLTIVVPSRPDNHECYNIYCILHYNLDTCKKTIREQFDDYKDYDKSTSEPFQFRDVNDSAVLSVEADVQAAEILGWQIVFDSTQQIPAKRVNFFDAYVNDITQLISDCNIDKTYPPRFVIKVAPQNAWSNSQFTLVFKGADRELKRDILLIHTQNSIPNSQPPDEKLVPIVRPFQKQNGYWPDPNY